MIQLFPVAPSRGQSSAGARQRHRESRARILVVLDVEGSRFGRCCRWLERHVVGAARSRRKRGPARGRRSEIAGICARDRRGYRGQGRGSFVCYRRAPRLKRAFAQGAESKTCWGDGSRLRSASQRYSERPFVILDAECCRLRAGTGRLVSYGICATRSGGQRCAAGRREGEVRSIGSSDARADGS